MISAVNRIEVTGQAHPYLVLIVADTDRGGTVVEVVVDADVRAQVECRRRQLSHPAPEGRVRAVGFVAAAVVEHALGAVPNLDARAAGAPHELQALRDVVQPRVGDRAGTGDHEVVGHTVRGHTEVGHQIVTAGTDLVGDDDPGAAGGQRPGVGGFVERGTVEVAAFQHGDIGDAGFG